MKKEHILILGILFSCIELSAQTFTQEVTANGGGYYQQINGSMQFTLGEPLTETYSNTNAKMTQGFEQGNYLSTVVNEIPGISEVSVHLFPNPSSGLFSLQITSSLNYKFIVKIYNSQGEIIYQKDLDTATNEVIDISSFAGSVYFVVISEEENRYLKTYKILKQ